MAAKVITRPKTLQRSTSGTLITGDDTVSRLLSENQSAIQQIEAPAPRTVLTQSLVVGANRINHGLTRPAKGATVTPTVADATFAWSFASVDANQCTITVVGVAQPNATLEIF